MQCSHDARHRPDVMMFQRIGGNNHLEAVIATVLPVVLHVCVYCQTKLIFVARSFEARKRTNGLEKLFEKEDNTITLFSHAQEEVGKRKVQGS